jgi:hypothetical protein
MTISQLAFRAFLASTVVVCASAVQAQAPSSQDLVGTWKVTMTSPQGSHPMTLTVTDTAGKLAGTVSGEMGSLPASVETSEAGVKILFTVDYQGSPLPIALTGKLASGALKGTSDYGNGMAAGEFEGSKEGAAAPAATADASSVAGTWTISSSGGDGWSLELTQEAAGVSGFLKNAGQGVTLPVKGTLEAGALTLAITGGDASGTIKGTLEAGALKGSYEVNGDTGTWSATRKP